jgi:asparaginyl-tRNA synthetase
MSQRTKINVILSSPENSYEATVKGWVRTFRSNRFIALNDGSTNNNLQLVIDFTNMEESLLKRITTGAAISAVGTIVPSLGKEQQVEMNVTSLEVLGDCDPEKYPLQPKKHSLEFLRELAHLRFRTNTFAAVNRVRNTLAYAVHEYFQQKGFVYLHTPIITASDAEGAGQMFNVSILDKHQPPKNEDGSINYKEDFFGRATNLTVSGQLEAELGAMALSEVYTFGPTFRAENSNTTRHLAEFWMIEPEVAFNDLNDNMDLAEGLLKFCIQQALSKNATDLAFLNTRLMEEEKQKPANERSELSLLDSLHFVVNNEFIRLTYTEAIQILKDSTPNKKKKFAYLIDDWGVDLQSEHERYLVEKHFKKPVILTDYPKDIKAFYMRMNDDDKTVRAMDILFPGIGEIVGGSQREERLEKLEQRMDEMHIPKEEMYWYLDTRRFGTCQHAGFGLGFERLVLFVTGMGNIRDVIPFPRYPKNAAF